MVESILQHSKRRSVPIQEAKRWYTQNQHSTRNLTENQITSFSFTPDWDYPQIVPFKDSVDLLMVPIKENLDSIFHNANYQLVFSKDSLNNIQTRLLVLSATDTYYQSHKNNYSTADFTGLSISIDEEGKIRYPLLINQGKMYNISLDSLYDSYSNQSRGDSPYGCWNGSIGFFGSLYNWVRWTIEHTSINGGGSGNDADNFPGNWGWGFFGWPPCGNNPGGSGSGNGNSSWNTNPNGSSGGFGSSMFINYFTDAVFESSQYRDQVKKCKGNFIYSNDVNTPVIFSIDKSIFGFGYKLFVGAYDYYLDQLSQGNTNFQLKDAFAIVQTPPSTYKFFPNPFNLAQWKPKIEPIYQKMKKDFEEHKNCTGSLNTGPDGNSSCDCFEYMVEDVKRDFLKSYCKLNEFEIEFLIRHPEYQHAVVKAAGICELAGSGYYDCVNEQLLAYFYEELGVEELEQNDPGPFYDGTKPVCPEMFEFTVDKESSVLYTCGLADFKVKFVGNAGVGIENFSSIFVQAASTNNCSINLNVALANAINQAYSSTINLWNSNQLKPLIDGVGTPSLKATFYRELNRIFRIELNNCAPHYSVILSKVEFIDAANRFLRHQNHGTIWQNAMNDFNAKCQ